MVAKVYQTPTEDAKAVYSFDDSLSIFRHFFSEYKRCSGKDHPLLSMNNTRKYIRQMPYVRLVNWTDWDIDGEPSIIPVHYNIEMTDLYFQTVFREHVDRTIGHFFSDGIRYRLLYKTFPFDGGLDYGQDDLRTFV